MGLGLAFTAKFRQNQIITVMTFVDLLIKLAKRSPIFIPLFFVAGFLLVKGAILFVFPAFALGIVAAILIAHPIAEYLGEFAGKLYMPIAKGIPPTALVFRRAPARK